jgi:hypothetical protein
MSLVGGNQLAAQMQQPYGAAGGRPPAPPQEQPEVLTRGPVHEAFAEPINLEMQVGLVAPIRPPAIIEELPPAERPRGDQFIWVPGYWSWDGDRNGYVWVSACWRVAPPKMQWVPGYWSQVPEGWEWVAGFWAPVGVQEIEYLPAPPAFDNVQAPSAAPSADRTWVPACWYWYQGQYVLRAGYWLAAQPNWVWVPSHYVWTPRGYVFCEGYWDHPLETRGVLFAPVYFPPAVYARPGFSYSPTIVVDLGVLTANLFTYPRYSHYYFGDYYDDAYLTIGIYPRFGGGRVHAWYDPIYEHDRWRHRRTNPRWEENQRHEYDRRRGDKHLRPARTYREQTTRLARLPESQRSTMEVARLLTTAVARNTFPAKFEQIKTAARQRIAQQATRVQVFRQERTRWEATSVAQRTGRQAAERRDHSSPAERRQAVTPSAQHKPTFAPPREVHRAQPERVRISAAPIAGKRGMLDVFRKGAPVRPADEQKHKGKDKDKGKDNGKRKH